MPFLKQFYNDSYPFYFQNTVNKPQGTHTLSVEFLDIN